MYDLGKGFDTDIKISKTPSSYVFKGVRYRISVISDSLIRFEYSEQGKFNDYPTFFAKNRSFSQPKVNVEEDNEILSIKNDKFYIEYKKEKPFVGTSVFPDQNLRVSINGTDRKFPANTFYGEIVQAQLDADKCPIKYWDDAKKRKYFR